MLYIYMLYIYVYIVIKEKLKTFNRIFRLLLLPIQTISLHKFRSIYIKNICNVCHSQTTPSWEWR